MTREFLPELHWMKLMILNVDGRMTDTQFREFVRHNLPTVMGYKHAHNELVELGRLPREVTEVELTGDVETDRDIVERIKEKIRQREALDQTEENVLAEGFREGDGYGDHDVPCGSQHHYDRDTEPFHKK